MTSTVIVKAHCSEEKEVVVLLIDVRAKKVLDHAVLQNTESREFHIYGDRAVKTFECVKGAVPLTLDPDDPDPYQTITTAVNYFFLHSQEGQQDANVEHHAV